MTIGAGLLTFNTVEGDLALTPDDARWTPIHLTFDVPANMSVVVIAQIGEDSILTMVVYSDELNGLQPLFNGKTVVTITGTYVGGRNFDMFILPNGGWIRPQVTIIPYVASECTV